MSYGNGPYIPREGVEDEDAAYDDARQRDLDDEAERALAEAKRRASGVSAEQLSLQDAFIEGCRAGHMGRAAALNPYQDFTPEHAEWNRGRLSTLGNGMGRAA